MRRKPVHPTLLRQRLQAALTALGVTLVAGTVAIASCSDSTAPTQFTAEPLDPQLVAQGKEVFRFDTFGDEKYWTDTLRMHEVIQAAVSPKAALGVGLKVDADALPAAVKDAIAKGQVNLDDPAVTSVLKAPSL